MTSVEKSSLRREPWQQCANKLNQSTMNVWRRSTSLWYNSKYRCHQTNVLNRSGSKWHQSTERLHRLSLACEKECNGTGGREEASTPNELTPGTESPSTRTDQDSHSSPHSRFSTALDAATFASHASSTPREHDSAEEQIRDILNLTDQVMYQANHAKQFKSSKTDLLGEIELEWINSTIFEVSSAARDLAKLVEPYRLDMLKRKGKMRSAHRKSWKLVDYQCACERFSSLNVHQERLEMVSRHLRDVSEPKQHSSNESNLEAFAELPAETMEPSSSVIEVPSETASTTPQSDTTLVELPGNTPTTKYQSLQPIPKIVVTQAPDDPFPDDMGGLETGIFAHENKETDDIPYWEQTCDSIRLQQSESLSNIVAKMESTRDS